MQNKSASKAFTLIEIMVVVAVIGILLAIAIPSLVKARTLSQTKTCMANMRQLDSAITTWAVENNKSLGDTIETAAFIGATNYLRQMPLCPAGGAYNFDSVGANPQVTCSLPGHGLP
jgi:prepilin-type N-terminal cleavage/methylation domain-containing protein